ncbi:hypothetical protein GNP89_00020 [Aliivibrio fischeri]|uniref:hypothetical protein n=1 Tax=Aliivibrio fischeri TaxID=668 RepID=UPI0012D95725|nr:hypothetical protein [Aliivibrio fischeri]MUL00595.1 hypothetical protein [Aliivibrio fischeri]
MDKLADLESKIENLNAQLALGHEKIDSIEDCLFKGFIKNLKPKKFKKKFEEYTFLACYKTYKGYKLSELEALHANVRKQNKELQDFLNAVTEVHKVVYNLQQEYKLEVERINQSNKKMAVLPLTVRTFKQVKGTSMPNLPWEQFFTSKYERE